MSLGALHRQKPKPHTYLLRKTQFEIKVLLWWCTSATFSSHRHGNLEGSHTPEDWLTLNNEICSGKSVGQGNLNPNRAQALSSKWYNNWNVRCRVVLATRGSFPGQIDTRQSKIKWHRSVKVLVSFWINQPRPVYSQDERKSKSKGCGQATNVLLHFLCGLCDQNLWVFFLFVCLFLIRWFSVALSIKLNDYTNLCKPRERF